MIPNKSADLLTRLKSNAPDFRKPVSLVRQDSSAFISEMQDEESELPATESVEIARGLRGYWISSPEAVTDQTVLFFHGGGVNLGSTQDHLGLCARLAKAAQARVFSVDYRLAPEHVFPAPAEDAITAYKYLLSHGLPSHRIIPAGISAGEHWCLIFFYPHVTSAYPFRRAGVCMSPVVNMLFDGESVTKNIDNDWLTPAQLNAIRTLYWPGIILRSPCFSRLRPPFRHPPALYPGRNTRTVVIRYCLFCRQGTLVRRPCPV